MSSTYTVTMTDGIEAHVTVERGNSVGFPAHSYAFNADADIVSTTDWKTYNGYCLHEIIEHEIGRMFAEYDAELICEAVSNAVGHCDCDDDDDEE